VYGKRENGLQILEADGIRTATRLQINSLDVFRFFCFYLQKTAWCMKRPIIEGACRPRPVTGLLP
jgi:hypothetical protein